MKKILFLLMCLSLIIYSDDAPSLTCEEGTYPKTIFISHSTNYDYCSLTTLNTYGQDACVAEVEAKFVDHYYNVSSTYYAYIDYVSFTYNTVILKRVDFEFDIYNTSCAPIPECASGEYFDPVSETCKIDCPPGTIPNGDTCVCDDFTKYYDSNTSSCVSPCDPTDKPLPIVPYIEDPKNACSSGDCPFADPMCVEDDVLPCEEGWHSLNLIIVDCEGNTVEDVEFCSSVPCSDIYNPSGDDNSTDTPQDCDPGQYYDACHSKCVNSCPSGTVWSNKTEQCECWDTPPADDNNTDDNNTDDDSTDDEACPEGQVWDNFWQVCRSDGSGGSDSDGGSTTTTDDNSTGDTGDSTDDNTTGDGTDDNTTGDTGDSTDDNVSVGDYEEQAGKMQEDAEKGYKDQMNEFSKVLDGHLDVFRALGTDMSNLFDVSAPSVNAGGSCVFSTSAYGHSFRIDLGFAVKFAPFFRMVLNLILAYFMIRIYIFIFRDISNKFFAGGD